MQNKILLMEKKVRLKRLDTALDEYELSKLRLTEKIAKLDEEIKIQKEAMEELAAEIKELEASQGD